LEEAAEIAAKSNHLPSRALAMLNLGVALEGKGEIEAALRLTEKP
jgi:hypothetical protein